MRELMKQKIMLTCERERHAIGREIVGLRVTRTRFRYASRGTGGINSDPIPRPGDGSARDVYDHVFRARGRSGTEVGAVAAGTECVAVWELPKIWI